MDEMSLIPAQVTVPQKKHLTAARTFQGIPSCVQMPGGRLLACWYAGGEDEGPDNFVIVVYSDDRGESWSDAVAVVEPQTDGIRAFDANIFVDANGKVRLFWAQSYSPANRKPIDLRCGVFFSELTNYRESPDKWQWSRARRISDGLMLNKPVTLKNGDIALPIYVCRKNLVGAPENVANSGCKMYLTQSDFQKITETGKCLMPLESASWDETSIIEKRDGTLWMIIRAAWGKNNFESLSVDGGKTWSEPAESTLCGACSRFFITRLKSGRLLLINHLPGADGVAVRNNLAAMLSDDDGKTWYGNLMLDTREQISYPDGMEGEDGFIYITYDRERYMAGEILMARFTEDDVAAGKIVSKCSKFQMLINVSGGTGKDITNVMPDQSC